MALTTTASVKVVLGIPTTDSSQDTLLDQLVTAADAAIKTFLKRGRNKLVFTSWPESGSDTEYYSGNGTPILQLRYWPVTTLTSVYLDNTGYYGDGSSAFASTTLLTAGTDYVLRKDASTSASVSGQVRRLGAFGTSNPSLWPRDYASPGTLMGMKRAVWPKGEGNIKVTYTAGFASVPSDLAHAANELVVYLMKVSPNGGMTIQSESMGSYSYSLAADALGTTPALGTVRSLLSRYREIAL